MSFSKEAEQLMLEELFRKFPNLEDFVFTYGFSREVLFESINGVDTQKLFTIKDEPFVARTNEVKSTLVEANITELEVFQLMTFLFEQRSFFGKKHQGDLLGRLLFHRDYPQVFTPGNLLENKNDPALAKFISREDTIVQEAFKNNLVLERICFYKTDPTSLRLWNSNSVFSIFLDRPESDNELLFNQEGINHPELILQAALAIRDNPNNYLAPHLNMKYFTRFFYN